MIRSVTRMPTNKILGFLGTSILIGLLLFCFSPFQASAEVSVSREYNLKAAFLRYVVKFVSWPETSLPESEINLCIFGYNPSMQALNSINGKIINDRSLIIRIIPDLALVEKNCQILFVTKTIQDQSILTKIITTFKGKPILTYGDLPNFAELGGGMSFYEANNHLAMMINQSAIKAANLTIAPRMLRLVTIIPNVEPLPEKPVIQPSEKTG